MKLLDLIPEAHRKLVLNALLAGFWFAFATYLATGEEGWSALLYAASGGVRFAVGLIAKSFKGLPTIPVDE